MTPVTAASPRRVELLRDIMAQHPRSTGTAMRLATAVADQIGIPPTDLICLNLLASAGTAAPSWLAERLGMTTSAATKMLDRLERAGYVSRSDDPTDRRKIIVHPNMARVTALSGYFAPMWERMNEVLGQFTDEQLELVLEFNRITMDATEEYITWVRANGRAHPTRSQ